MSERKEIALKKLMLQYFMDNLQFTGTPEEIEITIYKLTSDLFDIWQDFTKQ